MGKGLMIRQNVSFHRITHETGTTALSTQSQVNFAPMELRNLKRFFLTPKALRKHNKKASFEITQKRLTVLIAIHFMNAYPYRTTKNNIHYRINKLGNAFNERNLNTTIDELHSANLLKKIDSQYYITVECTLLLQSLEKLLRKERFDK